MSEGENDRVSTLFSLKLTGDTTRNSFFHDFFLAGSSGGLDSRGGGGACAEVEGVCAGGTFELCRVCELSRLITGNRKLFVLVGEESACGSTFSSTTTLGYDARSEVVLKARRAAHLGFSLHRAIQISFICEPTFDLLSMVVAASDSVKSPVF